MPQVKKIMNLFAAVGCATYRSTADLSHSRVNRETGIIKDVSLITIGEARGHGQHADRTTLQQVIDCAKQYSGGLRVRFNPDTFDHGPGGLAGFIDPASLRIKGDQAVGDFHSYESYAHTDYLFEMAERTPGNFGLSIEFNGMPEEIETKRFARCDEIFAATFVDIPAANATGLFRQGGDEDGELNMKPEEITKIVQDALKPLQAEVVKLRAQIDNPETGAPSAEEKAAAGCTDDDDDAAVTQKVTAYRKISKNPATVGDISRIVMNVFRMTGGKPARASGDGEGARGNGEGEAESAPAAVTAFRQRVKKYEEAGMKPAKALMRAKDDDKKGYNAFVAHQQLPDTTGEGKKATKTKE